MNLIFQLQGEENKDQLKLLIFTEFVPTQAMLQTFLEERGIPCAILNGSMSMDERRMAQRDFRDNARVLIATDAGGKGLNLQFCHVVVNYDLPWNPMRIEQRIGRVDRIGQSRIVRAVNFVYENSVEGRPTEGAIAESRGERVRIYPTPELRSHISSTFTFAREWQPSGLPDCAASVGIGHFTLVSLCLCPSFSAGDFAPLLGDVVLLPTSVLAR